MSKLLKSEHVRDHCGGVCDMTIRRWMQGRDFPRPVYIGRVRYWKENEIADWLETQAATTA